MSTTLHSTYRPIASVIVVALGAHPMPPVKSSVIDAPAIGRSPSLVRSNTRPVRTGAASGIDDGTPAVESKWFETR
jgi:hypothetical protein